MMVRDWDSLKLGFQIRAVIGSKVKDVVLVEVKWRTRLSALGVGYTNQWVGSQQGWPQDWE